MKTAVQPSLAALPLHVQRVRLARVQRVVTVRASARNNAQDVIVKSTAFASLAGSFLVAGNAQAAVEVANLAAGDGRGGLLFLPLAAALGWVGFNIAGPALNQLNGMSKKSLAAGLGLGAASMMAAQSADAATETMQLAAGDGRGGVLFVIISIALGWVLFNIGGPALNQLDSMNKKTKKSLVAGLGLGTATLLSAQGADAATEAMQLAAGDGRGGLLFLPLAAALGWVGFNIAGPALNQLNGMSKKGLAAGLGLGAAGIMAAQSADAATETMQLAAGDGRGGALFVIISIALGWVLFNIGGPALNQLDSMNKK